MSKIAEKKALEKRLLDNKRKCIRTSHTLRKSQLVKELIEEEVYYECKQES